MYCKYHIFYFNGKTRRVLYISYVTSGLTLAHDISCSSILKLHLLLS